MDATQAYSHLRGNIIENAYRHHYYKETVAIAREARAFLSRDTGDQKEDIQKYRIRETDEQKKQRIHLTNTITSVALSPVYAYFEETRRTDGVKMEVTSNSTAATARVNDLHAKYYGEAGLHQYLHGALLHYNKYDPNAWLVAERRLSADGNTVEELYPVEVLASEALDYSYDSTGQLSYLAFTMHRQVMNEKRAAKVETLEDYYLYGAGYAWHFAQVHPEVTPPIDYEAAGYNLENIQNKTFAVRLYENGTVEVPAIRAGAYLAGHYNEEIAESPAADAYPILRDLQRDKSHIDVTKTLHVFPRLFEYVKPCNNIDEESNLLCERGYIGGVRRAENLCSECKGSGFIIHGSEQDVIRLLWPNSPEDIVELDKLSHYEELPFEIVRFLREEITEALRQVFMAVFNQETVDKALTVQTATEIRIEYDKIYNKLTKFARRVELAWEKFTRVGHQYVGDDEAVAEMAYPHDFKLKNVSELIGEYQAAVTAGLPYEALWSIQQDILKKQYRNNPATVADIKAFEKHRPWKDKSPEEVALILSRRADTDPQRILYENWSQVVTEVKASRQPGREFYRIEDYREQKRILYETAQALAEEIQYKATPAPFPALGMNDEPDPDGAE